MAAPEVSSVFTTSGLVAQLPYLLITIGVLAISFDRARALIAAGALIGLAHALLMGGGVVAAFWWALVLVGASLALARRLWVNGQVRFSPEEEGMLRSALANLPRSRARHLIDQGFWLNGRAGDVLTREEEPVTHLFYLSEGEAGVMSHGKRVGTCRAGDLIGEVTILTGDQASATVVLDTPARFWCAPATALKPYVETHDDVRRALEQGFTASLRAKLRASNERMAAASGEAA